MNKTNSILLYFLAFVILSAQCNKGGQDEDPNATHSPGSFIAKVNGQDWNPTIRTARYFPKLRVLNIHCFDSDRDLQVGVYLDSINPKTSYLLEANGSTAACFRDYREPFAYLTDYNHASAGGSFSLTDFDITKKSISGIIDFNAVEPGSNKMAAGHGEMKDIEFEIDTSGSQDYGEYTITGAKTTNWRTVGPSAAITCGTVGGVSQMDIRFASLASSFWRYLIINVPIDKKAGSYTIYPPASTSIDCGKDFHAIYTYGAGQEANYIPVSGTFNITSVDTAKRIFTGTFNITLKNNAQETIQITNGKVSLSRWAKLF